MDDAEKAAPPATPHGALIYLAAQMARHVHMPSDHWDDWKFSNRTPQRDRRAVIYSAQRAIEQCLQWAVQVRAIADEIAPRPLVDRFCMECGAVLIAVNVAGFDPKTGKRLQVFQCPKDDCHHTGRQHHWKPLPFWRIDLWNSYQCCRPGCRARRT